MKKYNWDKKVLSSIFASVIGMSSLGLLSDSIITFDETLPPDGDGGGGDLPPEVEETIKKQEALNIENKFYKHSLEGIINEYADYDWNKPYFNSYDEDMLWDEKNDEDITDSMLFKSYGYIMLYNKTSLANADFNRYIINIMKQEKDQEILNGFLQDIQESHTDNLDVDQMMNRFYKMKTLVDYETNILGSPTNDKSWHEGHGINILLQTPQIQNEIYQGLYSYSWLWQNELYNGIRYDYNLTRFLTNSPIALMWTIKESSIWGDIAELGTKSKEIVNGDYNADKWDSKLSADNNINTSNEKKKTLTFWSDKSKSFDGVKMGKSGYDIENVMDIEETWTQEAGSSDDGTRDYTKLGTYNINNNPSVSHTARKLEANAETGPTDTDKTSKWIVNDTSSSEMFGVNGSGDNQMTINKIQTIMPAKIGVQSSWNDKENYYTSFKYLFNFNIYERPISNDQYISDKKINPQDNELTQHNLWEWFGLDIVNDARSEMFIINQLINNDATIFTLSKEYWYNKGFYIELFGEDQDDYGNLIDADLLK